MGDALPPQRTGKGQGWDEMEQTEGCWGCCTRGCVQDSVHLQHCPLPGTVWTWGTVSDGGGLRTGWEGT